MSLDERDWYRDEQRRRAGANRSDRQNYIHPALAHLNKRGTSRLIIALAWTAIGVLLYAAFTYILKR
ncbi:hypothetical protein PBS_30390 [Paraburkholderia sp. 2C]